MRGPFDADKTERYRDPWIATRSLASLSLTRLGQERESLLLLIACYLYKVHAECTDSVEEKGKGKFNRFKPVLIRSISRFGNKSPIASKSP